MGVGLQIKECVGCMFYSLRQVNHDIQPVGRYCVVFAHCQTVLPTLYHIETILHISTHL